MQARRVTLGVAVCGVVQSSRGPKMPCSGSTSSSANNNISCSSSSIFCVAVECRLKTCRFVSARCWTILLLLLLLLLLACFLSTLAPSLASAGYQVRLCRSVIHVPGSAQGYFTAASPSLTQRRSNFDRSATFGTTLLQSRVARLCLWAPRSSEIVAISPKVLEYGMVL